MHVMVILLNCQMMFSVQTAAYAVDNAVGAWHNPSHRREQSKIEKKDEQEKIREECKQLGLSFFFTPLFVSISLYSSPLSVWLPLYWASGADSDADTFTLGVKLHIQLLLSQAAQ